MNDLLEQYEELLGSSVLDQLQQIATVLKGIKIVHINSTKFGGGVAEILNKMVPLTNALGLSTHWETIKGTPEFFECTKVMHNTMQQRQGILTNSMMKTFEEINAANAEELRPILNDANIVFIHDPQPAALIDHFPDRKGKWIWRCHIDASHPSRTVWKYLSKFINKYDASVFSLPDFVQSLPHPIYIILPSIDPLSEKNIDLSSQEILDFMTQFGIDPERKMLLQVSRFDYFKDPLGVIEAYRLVKKFKPEVQLVLAGGGATDDPESEIVLNEVRKASKNDSDIHILFLPSDAHRTINALQRASTIVIQKSLKEGFGLTVTEALWKSKPVIGGDTGGIRLQVIDHYTGFLVQSPEGAALRIRYLLQEVSEIEKMGQMGKLYVKENFLITRHLREYLTLIATLLFPSDNRIELNHFQSTAQ